MEGICSLLYLDGLLTGSNQINNQIRKSIKKDDQITRGTNSEGENVVWQLDFGIF